jgi:phosphoribosylanthranilate isomerase
MTALPTGFVKICGLQAPDHARAAVVNGADLIGFVFAPSRRQVSPAQVAGCIQAARDATDRPFLATGVFVNAPADTINQIAAETGIDLVQLHGDEPPALIQALSLPAIKALRPAPGASLDEVRSTIELYLQASEPPVAFLIDGYHPTLPGGGGVRADWLLAAELAADIPIVLAGGLDPANVAEAILTVRPAGVDVSSGVESHGVKDPGKIAAFIRAAKAAFACIH